MRVQQPNSRSVAILLAMFLGTLAWSPSAEAQDCIELKDALNGMHKYLDEVLLEEARSLALQAQRQLNCQEKPVNPLLLTALYGASGAVHLYLGAEKEARADFRAALATSPTSSLDTRYGEEASDMFETVRTAVLNQPVGKLTITGDVEAWIDGQPSVLNQATTLAAGRHLLQWQSAEAVMAGRTIDVGSGENRTLHLGKPPADQRPLYLASGGALALAGGTLLALATRKVTEFDEYGKTYASGLETEKDHENAQADLQSLVSQNHALAVSGSVMGLAGVGLAVMGLVQPSPGEFGISVSGTW